MFVDMGHANIGVNLGAFEARLMCGNVDGIELEHGLVIMTD
jgi:hypothetical protein